MRKKLFILLTVGFLAGGLIGNAVAFLASNHVFPWVSKEFLRHVPNPVAAFLLQTLVCGLDGAACMGGAALYEIENWSLLRATVTHYVVVVLGYLSMSLLLCWGGSFRVTMMVLGFMTVGFFAIWLILYLIYKKRVKELNELNRKHPEKDSCE